MENISTSLRRLHMSGMAMCWKTMTETHQADKLTFRDGLEILIQSEMDTRHHNKIARLIKNAGFRQGASLEELETSESRGISAGIISQLSTGEYINQGATVVISGPTGTGKSFLATALGESACRLGYRVKYYTLARLLDEVRLARLEGKELKFFEKMEHLDLLIIDDRYHKKSLILSSQLAVSDWYSIFSNEMLAEACLDRIVHKAIRFTLKGDSMRKKY